MRKPITLIAILLLLTTSACGGDSPTEPSPPACTFTVSPSSLAIGASGGPASITVTAASHCTWTASSDRGWMSIASGASGTGNGTVNISVSGNPDTEPRTGTVSIADQRVTVTEEGATPCTVTLPVEEAVYGEDPRTGTFDVRAPDGCRWTATSRDSWIEITSGGDGSGNGVVGYAIDRNRETTARRGTIAVNERTFAISQAAAAAASCDYSVAPVTLDACMSVPYELSTTVTTGPGCPWSVTTDASWISLRTAGGAGSGQVTLTLTDNWDAPRTGLLMIRWPTVTAGQNVRVEQAGCRYGVSVTDISIPGAGGAGSFDVLQQSDPITCGGALQDRCLWSAVADVAWIRITTQMPRVGDDRVAFTVDPNPAAAPRTGSIVIRDKVVRVTQAPK